MSTKPRTFVQFQINPALKRSFTCAARFRHQTLSQFLIQAGIAAVESARDKGLAVKPPAAPRDRRFKIARDA